MTEESKNQIILHETYYLDNFQALLDFVSEKYDDLLSDEEKLFIKDFISLSQDAQCLYVRLISRKGPYFRTDKLSYSEIKDINTAVNELTETGFFEQDPAHDIEFVLDTITKPELEKLIKKQFDVLNPSKIKFAKRADIVDHLLGCDTELLTEILYGTYSIVYPLYYEFITIFKLLFFGNTYNDLTEFILEDIGAVKFEKYEIRKDDRYFSERKVADDILILSQLRAELWTALQANDIDVVLQIGELLRSYDFHEKVTSKLEKSYTEIGRFAEKFQLWDEALKYYELSNYPPANERRIRVLEKIGQYQKASDECRKLLNISENEEEHEFADKFSETLKKKLNLPYEKRSPEKFNTELLELEIDKSLRIEEIVLNSFIENGHEGFYSENGIWKALFALLFWEEIFMPVPEVFFNPFQRGPVDLFTEGFRKNRKAAFVKRFADLESLNFERFISKKYDEKFTTANALMSWKFITKEQLLLIVNRIPKKHIIAVLDRMSRNLKDLRTGFPDLMIFDTKEKTYYLAEVKGPGDQLRPNQKRWLRFFEKNGISYKVIRVKAK